MCKIIGQQVITLNVSDKPLLSPLLSKMMAIIQPDHGPGAQLEVSSLDMEEIANPDMDPDTRIVPYYYDQWWVKLGLDRRGFRGVWERIEMLDQEAFNYQVCYKLQMSKNRTTLISPISRSEQAGSGRK